MKGLKVYLLAGAHNFLDGFGFGLEAFRGSCDWHDEAELDENERGSMSSPPVVALPGKTVGGRSAREMRCEAELDGAGRRLAAARHGASARNAGPAVRTKEQHQRRGSDQCGTSASTGVPAGMLRDSLGNGVSETNLASSVRIEAFRCYSGGLKADIVVVRSRPWPPDRWVRSGTMVDTFSGTNRFAYGSTPSPVRSPLVGRKTQVEPARKRSELF